MVQHLNKTLATTLSSNENEHHTNLGVLLLNVMMAYRSAEHETTECTPIRVITKLPNSENRFMLGREVTTPLDLIYEQPVTSKSVPPHSWVWELQDSMVKAHQIVQEHVEGEILRQKIL